jgi:hypothetical protein
MKVDLYVSQKKPSYGLVAPANTDIFAFTGEVGAAIAALSPLKKKRGSHELAVLYHGDVLTFLRGQIAQSGVGLVVLK